MLLWGGVYDIFHLQITYHYYLNDRRHLVLLTLKYTLDNKSPSGVPTSKF